MLGTEGCQDSSYSLLQSGIQVPFSSRTESGQVSHMKLPLSSGQVTALGFKVWQDTESTAPGVLTLFKNKL